MLAGEEAGASEGVYFDLLGRAFAVGRHSAAWDS